MPRISYVVVFVTAILLTLLPLGPIMFPWIQWQYWGFAAGWWLGMILTVGVLERRGHRE